MYNFGIPIEALLIDRWIPQGKGKRWISADGLVLVYKTYRATSQSAEQLGKTISIITDAATGRKEDVHRSTIIRSTRKVESEAAQNVFCL